MHLGHPLISNVCFVSCCHRVDGDKVLKKHVKHMHEPKPHLVSLQWLHATVTVTSEGELPMESVYRLDSDSEADEDQQQQLAPFIPIAATEKQQTADSEQGSSRQPRVDAAAEVNAGEAEQQLTDGGLDHTVVETAQQQEEATAEAETEPLKPGWARKKKNKSDWAEDGTTQSLTQFEKDAATEESKRAAEGTSQEIDDVDMAAADDESQWVDEDEDELKRERKKAGRRFIRERERKQKPPKQPMPINHNPRDERLGLVRFEPSAFDEDAIQDQSEHHAILSPLTDESEEGELESGSSSEFECSDEDSNEDDSSSSSEDEGMSELVNENFDDRKAQRKKSQKRQASEQRQQASKKKQKRVAAKKKKGGRSYSDEQESDDEWDSGSTPVRTPRSRSVAPAVRAERSPPQKKQRVELPVAAAPVAVTHEVALPPAPTEQNSISFSSLSVAEQKELILIAQRLRGFIVVNDDTADHVLVDSKQPMRTRKVLFGIARGSWIIDRSWLHEHLDRDGRLVGEVKEGYVAAADDEANYEVECWPGAKRSRLLQEQGGFKSLVFTQHDKVFVAAHNVLPRDTLEELIYLLGGQPAPDFFACTLCICGDDFSVADLGDQLVGLPASAFQPERIVTTEWLFDCITEGQRKPLDGYRRYTDNTVDEPMEQQQPGSPPL